MENRAYFDHAASSPLTTACRDAFKTYDSSPWAGANPNSLHTSGRLAFEALEQARSELARALGARRPSEIVFTSGGTESNNLGVTGIARAALRKSGGLRRRVLVFSMEHDSVLDPAQHLSATDAMVAETIPATPQGTVDLAALKDMLSDDVALVSVMGANDPAQHLSATDAMVAETIPATPQGTVDLAALKDMLSDDVALVSVMGANNEVGTVQPLAEVAELAHTHGAYVHSDAVQAFGHIPFCVAETGVDAASVAAHKLGGPVGIGALYLKSRTPIEPMQLGGGQEMGLRSGTPDVDAASVAAHKLGGPVGIGALYLKSRTPIEPMQLGGGQEMGLRSGTPDVRSAMGFAAVARDAVDNLDTRAARVRALADLLVDALCRGADPIAQPTVDAPRDGRFLPGVVHLLVPGHQTEGLVLSLDERGFEASGGSACSSGSLDPSHALVAMGIPRDLAFCSLRLSFDHRTTQAECAGLVAALRDICCTLPQRRRPNQRR